MAGQILKRILFLLLFPCPCEKLVCGTDYDCAFCQLLKTLVNKQKDLEKKIDLLLRAKANCSEGRKVFVSSIKSLTIKQKSVFFESIEVK